MAQRYSTEMGFVVTAESTNQRLIGRALLRLLAAKSEETAQRLRDEVHRYPEPSDGAYLSSEDRAPGLELEYDGDTAPPEPKKTPYRPPAAIHPKWDRVKKQPPQPEEGDVSMTVSEAWSETVADLVTKKTWDPGKT